MDWSQVVDVVAKEQPNLPFVICSELLDHVPESLKWLADELLQTDAAPEALLMAIEKLVAGFSSRCLRTGSWQRFTSHSKG